MGSDNSNYYFAELYKVRKSHQRKGRFFLFIYAYSLWDKLKEFVKFFIREIFLFGLVVDGEQVNGGIRHEKLVMTLAPPDLPFPFEAIEMRILKQPLPRAVPISGFSFSSCTSSKSSFLSDAYFLLSLLACFSNTAIVFTL